MKVNFRVDVRIINFNIRPEPVVKNAAQWPPVGNRSHDPVYLLQCFAKLTNKGCYRDHGHDCWIYIDCNADQGKGILNQY